MAVNESVALSLVKQRLSRLDDTLDEYLAARVAAAVADLEGNGIHLTEEIDDLMLVVDTAVWNYQNRDNMAGMPDWLRLRRRERYIRQHREAMDA